MDTKIDPVEILYAVGTILGVASVVYFGFAVLEDLSPTTTAVSLLLCFVAFLLAALYVRVDILDTVLYVLSAGSYVVAVAYVFATYDLGEFGFLAILAGSSALFVALGYALNKELLDIDRRKALGGIAVVVFLLIALLAFDVAGAQPTYTHDFNDTVEVPQDVRDTVTVGETTASNPFVLSRRAELPNVQGCVYTPEMEFANVRYEDSPYNLRLAGGGERSFGVVVSPGTFYDREDDDLHEAFADRESVPVEVADECPETADEPKLVIVTDADTETRPDPP
ncbi:MAG: hypothetical protein ACLFSW_02475 [Halobacteriales archaeon]